MSNRFSRVLALLPVGLSISICTTAAVARPEIRLIPVWGTDNVICLPGEPPCGETEIMLFDGGVEVTLFVEMAGWDFTDNDEITIGTYQGTVNSDTYEGGDLSGVGTVTGFDLIPLGYPGDRLLGAFQALNVCTDDSANPDMTDPVTRLSFCPAGDPASADCPASHPFCVERPDFAFFGVDNTATVGTATLDYAWSAASRTCIAEPEGTSFFYGGTLILEVPAGAMGTYNVWFFDNPNFTLFGYCSMYTGLFRTAGQITVGGACCMGDGACELLSEEACTSGGGSFFATSCEFDTDTDGVPDVCDRCPIDNPDDSDGDGACDSDEGCPLDANKIEPGICGCGRDDSNIDSDGDGVRDGCDPCPIDNPDDTDGDGTCNSDDGCPLDANKTEPGLCGCGRDDDAVGDSDGDGVPDCDEQCPGIDDAIFAPGCVDAIPTVSTWGLVVLSLLLLVGGKIHFGKLRPYGAAK